MKPRFDHPELIRYLNRTPIEDFLFDIPTKNGKIVIRGTELVDRFCKMEHYEASKVVEQWYWAEWYRMPIESFLHIYAESVALNGSIMPGILNFDIELEKYKNETH